MKFNRLISMILLSVACGNIAADIAADTAVQRSQAPTASVDEAKIKHWRVPQISHTFWDIAPLEQPFIDPMPAQLQDGIATGELGKDGGDKALIARLASEIADKQHGEVDSLLISHKGKLLFESYYLRGRIDLPHPQSSATKSYTSLAIGRAIQLGYLSLADLDKPVLSFLQGLDQTKFVAGIDNITLHQAMTMRSGLKFSADKIRQYGSQPGRYYGIKRLQAFFEDSEAVTKQSQTFNYQGPNPDIVMQVLDAVVPGSAQDFIKQQLFGKLGIVNYDWRTEQDGVPTAGAFSSLTSRDMLKLGSLVLNNGIWQGEQLIPAAYISQATAGTVALSDEQVENFYAGASLSNSAYGYFWWQTAMQVADKQYRSISAQGGGGITILLVAELDLLVVVTGHARQAYLQMIAEKVLPAFVR